MCMAATKPGPVSARCAAFVESFENLACSLVTHDPLTFV